jgi:hypothetical protein
MAKKENKSLIIWAVICLIVGLVMGLFLTTVVTAGKAMQALNQQKSAVNLEEARTNLTLDTLNVNTIRNRVNPLTITSTNDVDFNVSDSIQMNVGASAVNMYADSANGPKMNLKSHWLTLSGNHFAITDTSGNITYMQANTVGISFPNIEDLSENDINSAYVYYACITEAGELYRSEYPCR